MNTFIKVVNRMSVEERQSAMYDLRRKNRNRIFRLIYEKQQISRMEISNILSLSLPTVNQNLKELSSEGLIEFTGTFGSTGGRRPTIISLASKSFISIGAEISASMIRFTAIDLLGERIGATRIMRRFQDAPAYFESFAANLETFLNQNGIERRYITGVGISLPGIISLDSKLLETAPTLGVTQFPLSRFSEALPYPCLFDNDASAGGFAEQFGRDERKTMAYLSIEKGVGGAVFIDGKPYDGLNRRSAEFGHICVHPRNGILCSCGNTGCLEAHCSIDRLTADFGIPLEDFFMHLQRGEQPYTDRFQEYLSDLAVGIANIHMILDCDIVIGGQLTPFLEPYMPQLSAMVDRHSLQQFTNSYLSLSRLRTLTSSTGAALRWVQRLLEES